MSTYQSVRVSRFRLESLDAVRERIGIGEREHYDELLAGNERVSSFGNKIQKHMKIFKQNMEKLDEIKYKLPEDRLDKVAKTIGLNSLLAEDQNTLLRILVEKKMRIRLSNNKLSTDQNFQLSEVKHMVSDPLKCESLLHDLSNVTKEAHEELCKAEQAVVKEKTVESLIEAGYKVRVKRGKGEYLIRGTKDLLSVAAQVTSNGEMNIDMGGFDGNNCRKELDQINNTLFRKGIIVEIQDVNYHGKKSGGVLLQKIMKEVQTVSKPVDLKELGKQEEVTVDRRLILMKKNKIKRI